MKKQFLKKSNVLREGYINGLRAAQRIINEEIKRRQRRRHNPFIFEYPSSIEVIARDEEEAVAVAEHKLGCPIISYYNCEEVETGLPRGKNRFLLKGIQWNAQ